MSQLQSLLQLLCLQKSVGRYYILQPYYGVNEAKLRARWRQSSVRIQRFTSSLISSAVPERQLLRHVRETGSI